MVRIHKCEPMRLLSAARKIRIGADNWIYFLCTDFSSSSVFRTSRLDAKISFTRITIRISVLGPLGPLTARRVHSYAARISRTSFYLADLSASWSHMILRSALAALREWINRTYARGSALPRLTIHNSADGWIPSHDSILPLSGSIGFSDLRSTFLCYARFTGQTDPGRTLVLACCKANHWSHGKTVNCVLPKSAHSWTDSNQNLQRS